MSFGPEVMLNVEVSRVMSFGHYSRAQPMVARDKCMFSDKLMGGSWLLLSETCCKENIATSQLVREQVFRFQLVTKR